MEKTRFMLESEMEAIVGGGDISLKGSAHFQKPEEITLSLLQKPEEITLSLLQKPEEITL